MVDSYLKMSISSTARMQSKAWGIDIRCYTIGWEYAITGEEGRMPHIFKTLATITIWFLFIWGLILCLLDGLVFPIIGQVSMTEAYMATGLGIASLILSVVAMRLKKTLD